MLNQSCKEVRMKEKIVKLKKLSKKIQREKEGYEKKIYDLQMTLNSASILLNRVNAEIRHYETINEIEDNEFEHLFI